MKNTILVLILSIFSNVVFSQKWTNYTSPGAGSVYAVTIDLEGNKWFSSYENGVCKYDGKTITTYSKAQGLASNNISKIVIDKKGAKWFLSENGLTKFDGKLWITYLYKKLCW